MTKKRRTKPIISGGGFLEVLKVALPLILSNSCHAVNMFVDRLMLAQHSKEAVAAAFTGGLTNFTIACIFVGTIGYTGTFVAQYEGAHHRERIGSTVWQGIWLSLIGGLFLFACIWLAPPLFRSFGHDPAVTEQEIDYFQILCKGGFIFLLLGAVSSFWTGRGKTGFVLSVSALITLFNLPLNYIFIFGKLGLPEMGTAGAAWGTILADLIGLVIYFAVFFAPSARKHFQTHRISWDFPLLKRMIRFGLPSGIHLALDLIAFNTFSLLLGCYGVAVHEASSITFGINNIAFCPIMGIGMTASILVGQAVGGEQIPLAKKATRSCIILVVLYSLLMMLLFSVFQGVVLAPFTRSGDVNQLETLKISSYMLYFISAYLIFDGFNVVYSNALRGAGDTKFPMWVMTGVGIVCFALPCLLLYFSGFPWWSLWIVFDCEILLLGVIFTLRYRGEKWTQMRVIEVAALPDEN
ncbi:MAG: MATE family efflux transporter [Lentisphaeria bacterium]|nr:MATE family efflux transporter [Lentisphaeria bacterium]